MSVPSSPRRAELHAQHPAASSTNLPNSETGKLKSGDDEEKLWHQTLDRSYRALRILERRGYELAPLLHAVLKSLDHLFSQTEQLRTMGQTESYRRASQVLTNTLHERGRGSEHYDPACVLLKRAALELERVLAALSSLNSAEKEHVVLARHQVTAVFLSVLGAESIA